MIKHPLYDVAVNEVRTQATPEEKAMLRSNPFAWRDALQEVVDEVDVQFELKEGEFNDFVARLEANGATEYELGEAREGYEKWKASARVFKKHVSARLLAVKRLCQEAAEGIEDAAKGADVTKLMEVVEAARAFVSADLGDSDDEYDEALRTLHLAVNALTE